MGKKIVAALVTLAWIGVAGCSGPTAQTEVKTAKTDSKTIKSGKKFKKVLVIVDAKRAEGKKRFEAAFVKQINERGVEALPTQGILPADKTPTAELVLKSIEGKGIDSVLTLRLMEVTKEQVYQPPKEVTKTEVDDSAYGGMMANFVTTTEVVPGYFKDTVVVRVLCRLWDVKPVKKVWEAMSETYDPADEPNDAGIAAFSKKIVDALFAKKNTFF